MPRGRLLLIPHCALQSQPNFTILERAPSLVVSACGGTVIRPVRRAAGRDWIADANACTFVHRSINLSKFCLAIVQMICKLVHRKPTIRCPVYHIIQGMASPQLRQYLPQV